MFPVFWTNTCSLGDVITVTLGNKIPADVRWIQVNKLKLGMSGLFNRRVLKILLIDTSPLTGESEPVTSSVASTSRNYMESKNVGFMGTGVVQGSGVGVVVNTGNNTRHSPLCTLAYFPPN